MSRRDCRRRLAVGRGLLGPGRWPCAATTQRLLAAAAFAATAAAWLAETEPYAEELAPLEAPGAFEQRQADRRTMLPRSALGCCAAPSSSPEQ